MLINQLSYFVIVQIISNFWMNISAYILLGVVVFLILKLLLPNASKRFLKLQASLPTSKIRSIAKGLAEVEGKLLMKTPLFSPIKNDTLHRLLLSNRED